MDYKMKKLLIITFILTTLCFYAHANEREYFKLNTSAFPVAEQKLRDTGIPFKKANEVIESYKIPTQDARVGCAKNLRYQNAEGELILYPLADILRSEYPNKRASKNVFIYYKRLYNPLPPED